MANDHSRWSPRRPVGWTSGAPRRMYENRWIALDEFDTVAPTGRPALYGRVHFKNLAVGVLPLHEDGTVTLVGQQRFCFGEWSWEMPEGGVPHDEDPLEGAKRELREETGLSAAEWRPIVRMQLSNSTTDERAVCYLATGLSEGRDEPDETEAIEVLRVPFRDLLGEVVEGRVQDSMTVAAVLRVHHMAATGEIAPTLAARVLA